MPLRPNQLAGIAIALLTLILTILVAAKAWHSSFTHDEAVSYLRYMKLSVLEIATYKNVGLANNHILNSLCMKLTNALVGGTSEGWLRIHSVLSLPLFAFAVYRLFRPYAWHLQMGCFLVVVAQVYMLDFFALARGYAMSFALCTMSFALFVDSMRTQRPGLYRWSLLCAMLGVLASFVTLHYFLALIALRNIWLLASSKESEAGFRWQNLLRGNASNAIAMLVLTAVLWLPVQQLLKHNMLVFGGSVGFWEDSLKSLLYSGLYGAGNGDALKPIYIALLGLGTALSGGIAVAGLRNKTLNIYRQHAVVPAALFAVVLIGISTTAQHLLTGALFPWCRTALFIQPFVLVMIVGGLAYVTAFSPWKWPATGLLATLALVVTVHLATSFNFTASVDWNFDRNSKAVASYLNEAAKQAPAPLRIVADPLYVPALQYYQLKWQPNWAFVSDNWAVDDVHFHYVRDRDINNLPAGAEVLTEYKNSKSVLLKRNLETAAP